MAAGVKIELDMAAIAKLANAVKPAAAAAVEALKTDVIGAQVVPFRSGDMQNNQTFTVTEDDGDSITARLVTGAPQARRLYYHPEYNFNRGTRDENGNLVPGSGNPNAGGKWLKPWIDGDRKDFLEDTFRDEFKKKSGV